MRLLSPNDIASALGYAELVEALRKMFAEGCIQPLRHHHDLDDKNPKKGTLLLMPAWQKDGYLGLKSVTVMPENGARGLPSVQGNYLLFNATDGSPLALMDAGELTTRRTASASALAASYLARKNVESLLMVGAGAMAPCLIRAHMTVRPSIKSVKIWNHKGEKAAALAKSLTEEGIAAEATEDLEQASRVADVISCATLSTKPLIRGAWLKPGAHLDLVGAFTPKMRESDNTAMQVASLFVDTFEGGLKEAGDIVMPIKAGIIQKKDVRADLYDLCRGRHKGRQNDDEITLFKSTGAALEDLAAAILAYEASR